MVEEDRLMFLICKWDPTTGSTDGSEVVGVFSNEDDAEAVLDSLRNMRKNRMKNKSFYVFARFVKFSLKLSDLLDGDSTLLMM